MIAYTSSQLETTHPSYITQYTAPHDSPSFPPSPEGLHGLELLKYIAYFAYCHTMEPTSAYSYLQSNQFLLLFPPPEKSAAVNRFTNERTPTDAHQPAIKLLRALLRVYTFALCDSR